MKSNRQLATLCVSVFMLIALMVLVSNLLPEDDKRELANAEFLVS